MSHRRLNSGAPSPRLASTPLVISSAHASPFLARATHSTPGTFDSPKLPSSVYDGPARERLRWTGAGGRTKLGRVRDLVVGRMGRGLVVVMLVMLGWELGWVHATAGVRNAGKGGEGVAAVHHYEKAAVVKEPR